MARILALVGPTAVGKSALALAVAERSGGEIVNADALQVYRGLDIGTAKPTPEERARVPHHLVDVLDPGERYSAGRFAELAREALAGIAARGRPALVVGGSGLYLRALLGGIAPMPPVDPAVRARLLERHRHEGLAPLRAELERIDPVTAARLAPRDAQRTLRALEVALSSGRPLSAWLASAPFSREAVPGVIRVGLTLPRAVLYDQVAARVGSMVARGWLDEVRALLASGVGPEAPAFQAIGYSQWVRHLAGEYELEEATRRIVLATRRYAKRQETWFRREPGIEWHDARTADSLAERLARRLEN
ncbi:MAG: tRNA (adenosine(37)-N6)-dimethylallyltransferase MiaA [Thermoanaerobaculia bacterium]|nr:MAG: tRNA (adenosine(37)-N6)-dimethylallyltransferase MiaA [Thermoanaerobaculia bacterium]